MSYKKLISTFPTNLSVYNKNIFAVNEDINEVFSNTNFYLKSISNSTGSNGIIFLTSSLRVSGDINAKDNFLLRENIDLNDNQTINFKGNNLQINASNISFERLESKNKIVGKEITGSLEFIDENSQTRAITAGEGIEVFYNNGTKQFECTRVNSSLDSGDSTSLVFTCDPNGSDTNPIFKDHYVSHNTSESGVTENDKYNIRSNVGSDHKYCTNTVILRPGYGSTAEDDDLIRAISSGTKQIFEFKNTDVLPGWTTGSNDVIGNGDIYWPVSIDDNVKKSSQTIILDLSKLLEEQIILPGKSIGLKWSDSYRVETTYPILMRKSGGQYVFPSGSTTLGDDGDGTSYQGNNEFSYYLGKCTFDKDDLEGKSGNPAADDLSSVANLPNPISNSGDLKELSPFYFITGLNQYNYGNTPGRSGGLRAKFWRRAVESGRTNAFNTSSSAKRHVQKNNIAISTFKPRLMLNLGENSIVYKGSAFNDLITEISSSTKVTTSPPVLAKFEKANNYRFFNTYDHNITGGEKMHPGIFHKVFPDILPEFDGSYYKNSKITHSEISDFLTARSETEWVQTANNTPQRVFNEGQFKYSGFASYTILSSSFYYDIASGGDLNQYCKNNFFAHSFHTITTTAQAESSAKVWARDLKLQIPFVGLKDKSSSNNHSLGNVIKDKYYVLNYNYQVPTLYTDGNGPLAAFDYFRGGRMGKKLRLRAQTEGFATNVAHGAINSRLIENIDGEEAELMLFYNGINCNIPSNIHGYSKQNYVGTVADISPGIPTRLNGSRSPDELEPLSLPGFIWNPINGFNGSINTPRQTFGGNPRNHYNSNNTSDSTSIVNFRGNSVNSLIKANPNKFLVNDKAEFPTFKFFHAMSLPFTKEKPLYTTSATSNDDYKTSATHHLTYTDYFYDFIPELNSQGELNSIELQYIGLTSDNKHQWIIVG